MDTEFQKVWRLAMALFVAMSAGACKKSPTAEVQAAFQAAPSSPQSAIANEALKAFEKKDYPTAFMSLKNLRSDQSLSPEQSIAVQEMMGKVQTQIAERAAAGDRQAQAALEMMHAMPHR